MKEKKHITVSTSKTGINSQKGHPKSTSLSLACRKIAKQIFANISIELALKLGKYKTGKKYLYVSKYGSAKVRDNFFREILRNFAFFVNIGRCIVVYTLTFSPLVTHPGILISTYICN
jgi:hypothetical protein